MPTYEYVCNACGHRFDVRQSFNDDPITDCPQCGATVRRVLYPAGVIFKGSGWYKTDSRQASHSAAQPSTSSANGDSSSSDTGGDATASDSEKKTVSEPKGKSATATKPAADD